MDQLERDYASLLLSDGEAPCISLYQPTHRSHPERMQDQIRFRNLIRKMPSGIPLFLASPPQHHHLFRRVSRNPQLLHEAINAFPDVISLDELRERAWQLIESYYLRRLSGLIERFLAARSKGLGSDDLKQGAAAAAAGRVEALLIEAERTFAGTYDPLTGLIEVGDREGDNLLGDVGERVLKTSGDVVVVPSERMPTNTGIAATYRF